VLTKLTAKGDLALKSIDLLGKDYKQDLNAGGHPWSLQDGDESTLILFNAAKLDKRFEGKISSDGILWDKLFTLQAMETRAISLRKLIEEQVRDDQRRTIPQSTVSGEASWYVLDGVSTFGRVLVTNKAKLMARNYSCGTWTVLCGVTLTPYTSITVWSGVRRQLFIPVDDNYFSLWATTTGLTANDICFLFR
jgi:hypothetical protein